MVHLTPFFVKLKKRFFADRNLCLHLVTGDEFETNFCLDCTFIILLLADLESMSLGYLFFWTWPTIISIKTKMYILKAMTNISNM